MSEKYTCEDIEPLLTDFHFGEICDEDAAIVRAHVESCEACRAELAEIEATVGLMREALAKNETAPAQLNDIRREQILQMPLPEPRRGVWYEWVNRRPGQSAAAAWTMFLAKAALIVIIPVGIIFSLVLPNIKNSPQFADSGNRSSGARTGIPGGTPAIATAEGADVQFYTVEIWPENAAPIAAITEAGNNMSATNGVAVHGSVVVIADDDVRARAFAAAAENWKDDSIVSNEIPRRMRIGLPETEVAQLAQITGPLLARELERIHMTNASLIALKDKHNGGHLIVMKPGARTHISNFASPNYAAPPPNYPPPKIPAIPSNSPAVTNVPAATTSPAHP